MGCSAPGSSVHGIFQARILEWVAISYSKGTLQLKDQTHIFCICRQILYSWSTGGARGFCSSSGYLSRVVGHSYRSERPVWWWVKGEGSDETGLQKDKSKGSGSHSGLPYWPLLQSWWGSRGRTGYGSTHLAQIQETVLEACRCSGAQSCPTLRPHRLQHTRLLGPSLSPRACSNSRPLSQWCRPTTSTSVVPFSSCLQFFQHQGLRSWQDKAERAGAGHRPGGEPHVHRQGGWTENLGVLGTRSRCHRGKSWKWDGKVGERSPQAVPCMWCRDEGWTPAEMQRGFCWPSLVLCSALHPFPPRPGGRPCGLGRGEEGCGWEPRDGVPRENQDQVCILEGPAFPHRGDRSRSPQWEALAVVPARAGGGLGQVKNNKEVSQQGLEVS